MILLAVWITLPRGEQVLVGELACSDPEGSGAFESEFEYAASWLSDARRFPLDPISLPLRTGRFTAKNLEPPLGAFDDALPDDWGRALIARDRKLPRGQQGEPFLLRELAARHGPAIGAVRFVVGRGRPAAREPVGMVDLVTLAVAAEAFEEGLGADPHGLQLLFAAGSSLGGARPKALVNEGAHPWIAKFASAQRDGRFDVVGLEAVGLDLAAQAGLFVPLHDLRRLGRTKRRALLVERFDVAGESGRRHMVSLRTLCRERPGSYAHSYSELAEAVRQVSSAPQEDVDRLYRQMLFNAAFGNTDDHLKNFWMIHDGSGFRLSPAFDLVPDVGGRREHTLAFQYERHSPMRADVLEVADRWGVRRAAAILKDVVSSVSDFATAATERRVPAANIREIDADIERRVKRLRAA